MDVQLVQYAKENARKASPKNTGINTVCKSSVL